MKDKYLRIYRRFESVAGRFVTGIDPQRWEGMDWFRFKVIEGELTDFKNGKPQRTSTVGGQFQPAYSP